MIGTVVGVRLLIAGVIAIRYVLQIGTGRAVAIAVVAWIVAHVPIVIIHEIVS